MFRLQNFVCPFQSEIFMGWGSGVYEKDRESPSDGGLPSARLIEAGEHCRRRLLWPSSETLVERLVFDI